MSASGTNLNAKVQDIVHRYRPIEVLHPIVSEMYDAPEFERMFWSCLTQDLNLIRGRSQDLADGEVTAIQKAFRMLVDEMDCGYAAIELYVDEIIGLKAVTETNRAQTLATALQTRDHIMNQSHTDRRSPSPRIATPKQTRHPVPDAYRTEVPAHIHRKHSTEEDLFVSDQSETSKFSTPSHAIEERRRKPDLHGLSGDPSAHPSNAGNKNEMLKKLFITYQNAKKDFDATPKAFKTSERTNSAKFLRDTTENCLNYIAARQNPSGNNEPINTAIELLGGKATVEEMKSTLQEATEAAERGSGGKKRRFDEDWTDTPEAPAKMRPSANNKPETRRDPVPRGTKAERTPRKTPVLHRPTEQRPPSVGRRIRGIAKVERTPRTLYPASAGKGTRRVFPKPTKGLHKPVVNSPMFPPPRADCYRPAYDRPLPESTGR